MKNLAGKRALITGAASGIGRALAQGLAKEKTDLYLLDIDQAGLERSAVEARKAGVDVVTRWCDMASPEQVALSAAEAVERWAGVDLLVNNAGVVYHGDTHLMPAEEWERLLATNLHGALHLTRELLPWLHARPEAHVLNLCSILGLVGLPRVALYATTKFALVGFSEALRREYGRSGLGVTSLCPGFVKTSLFSSSRPSLHGTKSKAPPDWMCATPERIASQAIKAIRRNRRCVVMAPCARAMHVAHRWAPGLLDWAMSLGWRRRSQMHQENLDSYSSDRTEAIRLYAREHFPSETLRHEAA